MRAVKAMPLPNTNLTATGTGLRSVGGIDEHHRKPKHVRLVLHASQKQTVRKLVQSAIEGFISFAALLKPQVFKDEDGIATSPLNEPLGEGLDEGAGEVSLAGRQPVSYTHLPAHDGCPCAVPYAPPTSSATAPPSFGALSEKP